MRDSIGALRLVFNSLDSYLNGLKTAKFCQTSSSSWLISRYYLHYFPRLTAIYLIFITIFEMKTRRRQSVMNKHLINSHCASNRSECFFRACHYYIKCDTNEILIQSCLNRFTSYNGDIVFRVCLIFKCGASSPNI